MSEFKVQILQGDTWQVREFDPDYDTILSKWNPSSGPPGVLRYQGSLADCYAWIMLHDRGAL